MKEENKTVSGWIECLGYHLYLAHLSAKSEVVTEEEAKRVWADTNGKTYKYWVQIARIIIDRVKSFEECHHHFVVDFAGGKSGCSREFGIIGKINFRDSELDFGYRKILPENQVQAHERITRTGYPSASAVGTSNRIAANEEINVAGKPEFSLTRKFLESAGATMRDGTS